MAEDQIARPLIDLYWPDLDALIDERYDDPIGLLEVLYELSFRRRAGAISARERVVNRLVELSDQGFPWPSTLAPQGDGFLEADEWPQTGMLSYLGYHVGENGPGESARRAVLDLAYSNTLPNVNNRAYMAQWGDPNSSQRLRKMAKSIAAFCRNQKRKNADALSVREWESDLEYLRVKYYVRRYDFVWPSTELA